MAGQPKNKIVKKSYLLIAFL